MGCASLTIRLGDAEVVLRADRTALIATTRTLLLADVHLGKAQTIRALGAPLSADVQRALLDEPLSRWARAVDDTRAERVIVLGDLLHAPAGVTPSLVEHLSRWRETIAVPLAVVPGNHDRGLDQLAPACRFEVLAEVVLHAGISLTHDHATALASGLVASHTPTIAGHVHPAINIPAGCGPARAPVFAIADHVLTLPAFTTFAAGAPVDPLAFTRLIAIAGDELVPLVAPARRPR